MKCLELTVFICNLKRQRTCSTATTSHSSSLQATIQVRVDGRVTINAARASASEAGRRGQAPVPARWPTPSDISPPPPASLALRNPPQSPPASHVACGSRVANNLTFIDYQTWQHI